MTLKNRQQRLKIAQNQNNKKHLIDISEYYSEQLNQPSM